MAAPRPPSRVISDGIFILPPGVLSVHHVHRLQNASGCSRAASLAMLAAACHATVPHVPLVPFTWHRPRPWLGASPSLHAPQAACWGICLPKKATV